MNAPGEGHSQVAERILVYLNTYINGRIIYDTVYLEKEMLHSEEHNQRKFYPDSKEQLVPNTPDPKGNKVKLSVYVDADHAHDQATRRSLTGIIVESSTYGSELVAARIVIELIVEVRCMLRDLGVPIDGPTLM